MKNYLFDFDGTIADLGDAATLATKACFKDFGLEVPYAEAVRYYMGVPIETFVPELVEKQGKHYSQEQFEKMYDSFCKHYGEIEQQTTTLFPKMKETLNQLVEEGKSYLLFQAKRRLLLNEI